MERFRQDIQQNTQKRELKRDRKSVILNQVDNRTGLPQSSNGFFVFFYFEQTKSWRVQGTGVGLGVEDFKAMVAWDSRQDLLGFQGNYFEADYHNLRACSELVWPGEKCMLCIWE